MKRVTAKDFAKNFGHWRDVAQYDAVAVTAYNRTTGFFISVRDYTEYACLKITAPERSFEQLTEETLHAISNLKMDNAPERLFTMCELIHLCIKQMDNLF